DEIKKLNLENERLKVELKLKEKKDEEIVILKQQLEQYKKDIIKFNYSQKITLIEMEKLKKEQQNKHINDIKEEQKENNKIIIYHLILILILYILLNYLKNLLDIIVMYGVLIIQNLIIINYFVLDQLIIQLLYGILIKINKFNHLINIQVIYIVTIRFWDFKNNQQLQLFNENSGGVCGIAFSPFNGGRYLFSESYKTICLWDIETSKSLHIFNGHEDYVWCIDISSLKIIIIIIIIIIILVLLVEMDILFVLVHMIKLFEYGILKQLNNYVKYGSNELFNIILSGSEDKSVRLWDIRSGQQIQIFNGHTSQVWCVEYTPFIIKNINGNSNVICSGSWDNTIRFWDIRSNKNELYKINVNDTFGVFSLKFLSLKNNGNTKNIDYNLNLCYGSENGPIYIWG
ncbi:WD-40 repeat-containing protein, partial [Reticulomyxa filosa]